jgi:hypothetical protein
MVKPPPAGPPAPPRSQGGAWLPVGHRIGRTSTPNSGRSEKLRRDVFTCDGHPRLLRQPHRLERFLCVSSPGVCGEELLHQIRPPGGRTLRRHVACSPPPGRAGAVPTIRVYTPAPDAPHPPGGACPPSAPLSTTNGRMPRPTLPRDPRHSQLTGHRRAEHRPGHDRRSWWPVREGRFPPLDPFQPGHR